MGNSAKKHFEYYLPLVAILFLGFFLALATSYNRQFQTIIILSTVFCYAVWGILHHLLHHDLTLKIMIEYVLIGSLGLTIVLFLLNGGN